MTEPAFDLEQPLVSCEVCLKTIPVADATTAEVDDYVAYFCGLDCYEVWKHQEEKEDIDTHD